MSVRLLIFLLLFSVSSTSFAQINAIQAGAGKTEELQDKLQILEKNLLKLKKESRNTPLSAEASSSNLAAHMELRFAQVDREVRKIANKLEELSYQFARLESYLSRMNRDYDRRLAVLEQKTGTVLPSVETSTPAIHKEIKVIPNLVQTTEPKKILKLVNKKDAANTSIQEKEEKEAEKIPVDQLFEKGRYFLGQKKYKQSAHVFKKFVSEKPKSPLAGNAQFLSAESYFLNDDFTNAAIEYVKVYENYPTSAEAPEALLKLAKSLNKIGQRDEACEALGVIESQYKTSTAAQVNAKAREFKSLLSCE